MTGSAYDHFCTSCPECTGQALDTGVEGDRCDPFTIYFCCSDCGLHFEQRHDDTESADRLQFPVEGF